MNKLSVIELFAGIGSQRSALDRLGIDHEVVGIAEIDKHAIKSYESIYGSTRNFGDIMKIERLPYADLWTYSFPCTDISLAGKQQGLQHANKQEEGLLGMLFDNSNEIVKPTRSGLLYEVQRLLWIAKDDGSLPKFLLLENVKALVGKKFMSDFQGWLDELDMIGYNSYWKVLNAKDYGIPQNRERVFVVSIRKDIDNRKFKWPMRFPLKLRLKDLLEDKVDEKYYLSDKILKCFTDMSNRNGYVRGEKFIPMSEDKEYSYAITTREGSRPENNYIKVVGSLGMTTHEQTNRVYDPSGLSPTINTMQGGNLQPKIAVKEYATYISWEDDKGRINTQDHRAFKSDSVSGTVPAMERGVPKIAIPEATKQGYALAKDVDGVYLNRPHQKRGTVQDGMIQTIKTGANDIGVVVLGNYSSSNHEASRILDSDGIAPTIKENHRTVNGVVVYDDYNSKIRADQDTIGTLTTNIGNNAPRHGYKLIEPNLRVRKLTPKECYRLMGFTDEQFDKAASVCSNSQLYKQAGNSIVVDVLYHIFKSLFIESEIVW